MCTNKLIESCEDKDTQDYFASSPTKNIEHLSSLYTPNYIICKNTTPRSKYKLTKAQSIRYDNCQQKEF